MLSFKQTQKQGGKQTNNHGRPARRPACLLPVKCVDAVHDCGSCGLLLGTGPDVCIRTPTRSIKDGADLVQLIDARHLTGAEVLCPTAADLRCLLLRERARDHAEVHFFHEASPDFSGIGLGRRIVGMSFWWGNPQRVPAFT